MTVTWNRAGGIEYAVRRRHAVGEEVLREFVTLRRAGGDPFHQLQIPAADFAEAVRVLTARPARREAVTACQQTLF